MHVHTTRASFTLDMRFIFPFTYISSPDDASTAAETISFLPFLFLTIFPPVTSTRLYVGSQPPQTVSTNAQFFVNHTTRIKLISTLHMLSFIHFMLSIYFSSI